MSLHGFREPANGDPVNRRRPITRADESPAATLASFQRAAGNQAVRRLLNSGGSMPPHDSSTVQRTIWIGPTKQNAYRLAQVLDLEKTTTAGRLLWPMAHEWLLPAGGEHRAANGGALRTQLVSALSARWVEELRTTAPTLHGFLSASQFYTLVFMSKLSSAFDVAPLEAALQKVQAAAHVEQSTVMTAISPGKLPLTIPSFGVFAENWAAKVPGVTGLVAEFESAASVDPAQLRRGQKVRLSSDFQLGAEIGGQSTQDADVSFVDLGGRKVLIEVAASVNRLRDKMGVEGANQRLRYRTVAQRNEGAVLAYSVPAAGWPGFFDGVAGTSIGERLPTFDVVPWGLLLGGRYVRPDELTSTAQKIRFAEARVPGFWEALAASQLTFAEVFPLDGQELSDRLQRNARRL